MEGRELTREVDMGRKEIDYLCFSLSVQDKKKKRKQKRLHIHTQVRYKTQDIYKLYIRTRAGSISCGFCFLGDEGYM